MRVEMEEIAADQKARPAPGRWKGAEGPSRSEKAHFFEHAGIGQENLSVDMEEGSLVKKGGGVIKQPLFQGRLFDESHDQGHSAAGLAQGGECPGGARVQGGFGDEIAQPIAAQTQLWKNEEIGPGPAGFGGELEVGVEVPGDISQNRRILGQGDFHVFKLA